MYIYIYIIYIYIYIYIIYIYIHFEIKLQVGIASELTVIGNFPTFTSFIGQVTECYKNINTKNSQK